MEGKRRVNRRSIKMSMIFGGHYIPPPRLRSRHDPLPRTHSTTPGALPATTRCRGIDDAGEAVRQAMMGVKVV